MHIAAHAAASGVEVRGPFYVVPGAGLHRAARLAAGDLEHAGLVHAMVNHVCSSQAFALNLFAGLGEDALTELLRRLGIPAVEVEPPAFEWTDPGWLKEATPASPHATQIDVALRSHLDDGRRHLLLIEVKLVEDDFSTCSAFQSSRNDAREVCRREGPFGSDPARCFQLRNHDRGERRRYDTFLQLRLDGPPLGDVGAAGCWFRGGTNQVMRQVALARAAIANDVTDEAAVALCAPWGHLAMWRRWAEARPALENAGVPLIDLPADGLVGLIDPVLGSELVARYRLGLNDPEVTTARDEIGKVLRAWAPGGLAVENPDAGPGFAAIFSVGIEDDPWTPSQVVLRCHLGFHDYPYALPPRFRVEQRHGLQSVRVLSDGSPRWILSTTRLREAGLSNDGFAATRLTTG